MYGPLTLHSSVKDLVKYTQNGLDFLSKEKDSERWFKFFKYYLKLKYICVNDHAFQVTYELLCA